MNKLVIKWIELYQAKTVYAAPTCRFNPTCSNYAKQAFQTRNFFVAAFLSGWRILRCNPFNKGGYDPVPEPKKKGH